MLTFSNLHTAMFSGPTWIMIGNFDGLHLGHQALILRACELATADPSADGHTALISFDPHPLSILRPDRPLLRLTTPSERLSMAAALGIEIGVTHPFTPETARMEARDFIRMLITHLGMKGIVAGPDFALGRNRSGNITTLRELGHELNFKVEVVQTTAIDGITVRSSAIRDLLQTGNVETAARMLGRPYTITGEVRLGDQRGRTIGIPTANIAPPADKLLPANGVYATVAHICTPARTYTFPSVTNIGVRPTVDGFHHRIEAHLLDFPPPELPDNLYGQTITLSLTARLRDEMRFPSLDALVAQIRSDTQRAREILDT